MARSGLYKSDVQKARDALIAQGINPSVDAVRVALGNTGSKTTIHKYLKELESEDGGAGGKRASVSEALQDLVERLAVRLQEEAEERVAAVRVDSDAKAAEHVAALQAAQKRKFAAAGPRAGTGGGPAGTSSGTGGQPSRSSKGIDHAPGRRTAGVGPTAAPGRE